MKESAMEKSQTSCKDGQKMDYASQASAMIVAIAGPRDWNTTRQRMIEIAARKLGFTYSRTFSLYYKRARVISAQEWDRMKDELTQLRETAERSREAFDAIDKALERNRLEGSGQDARPAADGNHESGRAGFQPSGDR
jgi:hypothetical protein